MNAGMSSDEVVKLAASKLVCTENISNTAWSPVAQGALVDVQLRLDYEAKQEAAQECKANLVASHMCIAYSFPKT